jgi:hypothetical protein
MTCRRDLSGNPFTSILSGTFVFYTGDDDAGFVMTDLCVYMARYRASARIKISHGWPL